MLHSPCYYPAYVKTPQAYSSVILWYCTSSFVTLSCNSTIKKFLCKFKSMNQMDFHENITWLTLYDGCQAIKSVKVVGMNVLMCSGYLYTGNHGEKQCWARGGAVCECVQMSCVRAPLMCRSVWNAKERDLSWQCVFKPFNRTILSFYSQWVLKKRNVHPYLEIMFQ